MINIKKEVLDIKGIKKPSSPFNHVIKAGNFLFLTSQLSTDLKTNKIIPGNISEQTKNALENMKFLLESSGSNMDNVLKVSIFMKDIKEFNEMNRVYEKYFKPGKEPARVTVQSLSPIEGIRAL